jgi:hypothetical protein
MMFRNLRQPRRGHRVMALHGRRVSVSYSLGLEGQLVLVVKEVAMSFGGFSILRAPIIV